MFPTVDALPLDSVFLPDDDVLWLGPVLFVLELLPLLFCDELPELSVELVLAPVASVLPPDELPPKVLPPDELPPTVFPPDELPPTVFQEEPVLD